MGIDEQRQTGRTTRMLNAAAESAREGRRVFVIAADYDHASYLRNRAVDLDSGLGSIVVIPQNESFDWDSFRPLGMRDGDGVFVDHLAVEQRYRHALRALHRFDQQ